MAQITGLVPERLKTTDVEGVWDMTADEVKHILQAGTDADPNPPRKTKEVVDRWGQKQVKVAETEAEYYRRIAELRRFIKLRRIVIRDMFPDLVFVNHTIQNLDELVSPTNVRKEPRKVPPIPPTFSDFADASRRSGPLNIEFIQNLCNRVHEEWTGRRPTLPDEELNRLGIKPDSAQALELEKPRFADFSMRSVYTAIYTRRVDSALATRNVSSLVRERIKDLGFELAAERIEQERIAQAEATRLEKEEAARRAAVASELAKMKSLVMEAVSRGEVDRPVVRGFLKLLSEGTIVSDDVANGALNILSVLDKTPAARPDLPASPGS